MRLRQDARLRRQAGLNGKQTGEAIAWAIRTLVADLRRRNEAARANQRSVTGRDWSCPRHRLDQERNRRASARALELPQAPLTDAPDLFYESETMSELLLDRAGRRRFAGDDAGVPRRCHATRDCATRPIRRRSKRSSRSCGPPATAPRAADSRPDRDQLRQAYGPRRRAADGYPAPSRPQPTSASPPSPPRHRQRRAPRYPCADRHPGPRSVIEP
jgi:hypothetical protein